MKRFERIFIAMFALGFPWCLMDCSGSSCEVWEETDAVDPYEAVSSGWSFKASFDGTDSKTVFKMELGQNVWVYIPSEGVYIPCDGGHWDGIPNRSAAEEVAVRIREAGGKGGWKAGLRSLYPTDKLLFIPWAFTDGWRLYIHHSGLNGYPSGGIYFPTWYWVRQGFGSNGSLWGENSKYKIFLACEFHILTQSEIAGLVHYFGSDSPYLKSCLGRDFYDTPTFPDRAIPTDWEMTWLRNNFEDEQLQYVQDFSSSRGLSIGLDDYKTYNVFDKGNGID